MSENSSNTLFEDEPLKVWEHIDPDKHWIGESLPAPSTSETSTSGTSSSTGESPFPSRADHTHDNKLRFMQCHVNPKACPGSGTKTYIDGLTLLTGTSLFAPASSQLLLSDIEGLWQSTGRLLVLRTSSTFPATTSFSFDIEYNGGVNPRILEQSLLPAGRSSFYFSFADVTTLSASGDAQLAYTNHDSATHNVYVAPWTFCRLGSAVSG